MLGPRDYALLAQEAYTATPDIGIADSASRAIMRQTSTGLVVAFPGSDNVPCWLADLSAIPRPVLGMGNVHDGFYGAWEAIAPQVLAAIGDQPVTLVGHSLGGSIALLAAATLTLAGKPPVCVQAFEPARVSFDLTLRILMRAVPLHLWRNGSDPVTELPLDGMHPAMLAHVGKPAGVLPIIADHLLQNIIPNLPGAA